MSATRSVVAALVGVVGGVVAALAVMSSFAAYEMNRSLPEDLPEPGVIDIPWAELSLFVVGVGLVFATVSSVQRLSAPRGRPQGPVPSGPPLTQEPDPSRASTGAWRRVFSVYVGLLGSAAAWYATFLGWHVHRLIQEQYPATPEPAGIPWQAYAWFGFGAGVFGTSLWVAVRLWRTGYRSGAVRSLVGAEGGASGGRVDPRVGS